MFCEAYVTDKVIYKLKIISLMSLLCISSSWGEHPKDSCQAHVWSGLGTEQKLFEIGSSRSMVWVQYFWLQTNYSCI